MRNELIRQYLVVRPLMEVNVRTAIDIQKNTFENLPHLANSPDVGELQDQFRDIPFVLVGAGPSLMNQSILKNVQNKAIIVASNSPYRKLINNEFALTWLLQQTLWHRLWLDLKMLILMVFHLPVHLAHTLK